MARLKRILKLVVVSALLGSLIALAVKHPERVRPVLAKLAALRARLAKPAEDKAKGEAETGEGKEAAGHGEHGEHGGGEGKLLWYSPRSDANSAAVQQGVKAFERQTGVKVHQVIGTHPTQESEDAACEALSSAGYVGFALRPVDAAGSRGLFERLAKQKRHIVAWGTEPSLPTPAAFTVATNTRRSATEACSGLLHLLGNKGRVLYILEHVGNPALRRRIDGVREAAAQHKEVHLVETTGDVVDQAGAAEAIRAALAKHGAKLAGVLCTGTDSTLAAVRVLGEWQAGRGHQHIRCIGVGTSRNVLDAVRTGVLDATVAENPAAQGYISCALLDLLNHGWEPRKEYQLVDSGTVVVSQTNLDSFEAELERITESLATALKQRYVEK